MSKTFLVHRRATGGPLAGHGRAVGDGQTKTEPNFEPEPKSNRFQILSRFYLCSMLIQSLSNGQTVGHVQAMGGPWVTINGTQTMSRVCPRPIFAQNLSYWQAIGPGPQLIETKLSPLFVHVQCLSIVQNMSSVCQSLKYCDI